MDAQGLGVPAAPFVLPQHGAEPFTPAEGQAGAGTPSCAAPFGNHPPGTSLVPRSRHSWVGPEQQPGPQLDVLRTAGVQTGTAGLGESKAPGNCSLAGTDSLQFWPSVCCGTLGHVLRLV